MILRLSKFVLVSFFLVLFVLAKPAHAYQDPVGYVNDFADVLSEAFEQDLETKLASFSAQIGPEITVVTIASLEGDTVENYAEELFDQWGIGKEAEDNGVLFLAAITDRKMRIEVGYGVEAMLNDAKAGRIIRDDIAPDFKNEDYESGIEIATDKIIQALTSEPLVSDGESSKPSTSDSSVFFTLIFGAIFVSYIAAFLARSKSWWAGGVIGFIIGTFISLISGIIFGIFGLFLDYLLSSNYKTLKKSKKPTGFWSSKGGFWTGGSSSRGGFGGFGGGSSGGGGASGSW